MLFTVFFVYFRNIPQIKMSNVIFGQSHVTVASSPPPPLTYLIEFIQRFLSSVWCKELPVSSLSPPPVVPFQVKLFFYFRREPCLYHKSSFLFLKHNIFLLSLPLDASTRFSDLPMSVCCIPHKFTSLSLSLSSACDWHKGSAEKKPNLPTYWSPYLIQKALDRPC